VIKEQKQDMFEQCMADDQIFLKKYHAYTIIHSDKFMTASLLMESGEFSKMCGLIGFQ